jgi:hypothetical protein
MSGQELPSTMMALTFQGKCDVSYEAVPTPALQEASDAIVK